ncbi:histidinol-phosphate aminotransferase [Tenacibaculum skagerrakense]|uniref:Histidinol-phosphate aminotransferase n=1 Tax=Tenacibaculum skagerrakense TaxID=186571 RepID=A0A4R2NWI7_9FLAO|nr:histidinol-phosphate transaminase [Tenacibaculum skagerrakense]TCP25961.1 histidinol-phosphate aminotransferase [Tenacibaculum skagerrakense]
MFSLEKIVRKNIWNLTPYSSARDEFKGTADVFLDANENPYGNLNRYPDPQQIKIKEKLAKIKNVSTDQIFIGNGSDEVIDLAFRIFCEPGVDKALTFSPTYGMYDVSADINNIELIKQPLINDFQINLNQLQPYLDDPLVKIIFVCSPNNPTGNTLNTDDVEYIIENFEGVVIIDEAYIDFSSKKSFIEKINEYPNLIVSQTFSKAWGLAGVRVGVAYTNNAILDLYNRVKPPYNVSVLNQDAVLESLHNFSDVQKNIDIILEERSRLKQRLASIKKVNKIYPSDANFLLVNVDDADKTYNYLIERKVIIRNRNKVINNCIRITVGTPEENERLIEALKNIS